MGTLCSWRHAGWQEITYTDGRRSCHPASSEKSNVNPRVRRSAVGATRFASRGFRLVFSRAREQNGGTTRGNRQREERGRPPARYGTTETGAEGMGNGRG